MPLDKAPVRAGTPTSKPNSADGTKTPEKTRSANLSKPPVRGSIPPKRPITAPKSPPTASSSRERPKPISSASSSTGARRPPGSATGPTSSTARRTPTVSSSPGLSTHKRVGSRPEVSKPGARLRDVKKEEPKLAERKKRDAVDLSRQEAEKVLEHHDAEHVLSPGSEKAVKSPDRGTPEKATAPDDALNDELVGLRQEIDRLQGEHARDLDNVQSESKAKDEEVRSLRQGLIDFEQSHALLGTKISEVERLEQAVSELEQKIQSEQKSKEDELADATHRRDRAFSDASSRHRQELRDVISRNEERAINIRRRHVEEMSESQTKHQRQIEEITQKHKQEIQDVHSKQEQRLQADRSTHAQEREDLIASHKKELEDLSSKDNESSDAARRHQEEIRDIKATHDRDLRESDAKHAQQLKKAAAHHKQELDDALEESKEAAIALSTLKQDMSKADLKHKEEIDRLESQLTDRWESHNLQMDELRQAAAEAEAKLKEESNEHVKEVESLGETHQREHKAAMSQLQQDLENAKQDHERSTADTAKNHEEEIASLQSEIVAKAKEAKSLQAAIEKAERDRSLNDRHQRHHEEAMSKLQRKLEDTNHAHEQSVADAATAHKHAIHSLREQAEAKTKEASSLRQAMEKAQQDRISKDSRISELQQELTDTKHAHEQSNADLSTSHKEEVERLSSEFAHRSEEVNSLRQAIQKAEQDQSSEDHREELQAAATKSEKEMSSLRDEKIALTEQLHMLRAAFEEAKNAHKHDMEALTKSHEQQLEVHAGQHERALHDLASSHGHIVSQVCEELNASKAQVERLKTDLRSLEQLQAHPGNKDEAAHTQKLNDVVSKHQEELSHLRNEHETVLAQLSPLKAQLQAAEDDRAKALQNLTAQFEYEREALRKERDEANALRAKSESNQKLGNFEKKDMVKNAQVLRRALDCKQKEHVELVAKHDSASKELESSRGTVKQLEEQQGKSAAETSSKHHEELKEMQEQQMNTMKELTKLQQSSKAVTQERDEAKAAVASLQDELNSLADQQSEARKSTADLQEGQVIALRSEHDKAKKEIATLQETLQTLKQTQADSSRSDTESHDRALRQLREERDAVTAELASLQCKSKDLEDSSASLSAYEATISQLRTEQETTKQEASSHQKAHQEALSEIDALKEQLSTQIRETAAANESRSEQLHTDLRKYMMTLKRQYGIDKAEMEELKRDMESEEVRREEDWKKQEEMRAVIAAELGRILGEEK